MCGIAVKATVPCRDALIKVWIETAIIRAQQSNDS